MSFYQRMEKIIKEQGDNGLDVCLYYYGVELDVFRESKSDAYGRVHRNNSGGSVVKIKEILGILENDDFFPTNGSYASGFENGFLYTKDADILVGDLISIASADGRSRKYKLIKKTHIGNTRNVFTRWEVSAIGV